MVCKMEQTTVLENNQEVSWNAESIRLNICKMKNVHRRTAKSVAMRFQSDICTWSGLGLTSWYPALPAIPTKLLIATVLCQLVRADGEARGGNKI